MTALPPVFLLGGGNWRRPDALVPQLRRVLAATGRTAPRVAVLGAANGDSLMFHALAAGWLKKAGAAEAVRVRLARRDADAALARTQLAAADAVFLSGGDVEAGMRWINHHRLAPALRALRRRGRVFFGVSAGAILLGTRWVRWSDPDDDATAEVFPCLGLAPVLCDTHAEADGWEELAVAVRRLGPGARGYGIPSGGALSVSAGGRVAAWDRPAARAANRAGRVVFGPDLRPAPTRRA